MYLRDLLTLMKNLPVLFGADFLLQLSLFALLFRKLLLLCQQLIVTAIQGDNFLLQGLHPFINVS